MYEVTHNALSELKKNQIKSTNEIQKGLGIILTLEAKSISNSINFSNKHLFPAISFSMIKHLVNRTYNNHAQQL